MGISQIQLRRFNPSRDLSELPETLIPFIHKLEGEFTQVVNDFVAQVVGRITKKVAVTCEFGPSVGSVYQILLLFWYGKSDPNDEMPYIDCDITFKFYSSYSLEQDPDDHSILFGSISTMCLFIESHFPERRVLVDGNPHLLQDLEEVWSDMKRFMPNFVEPISEFINENGIYDLDT